MDNIIFTPEQTAELLHISTKTIRDWLRAGKIKGIKIGKLWLIKENDLQQFLNQNRFKKIDNETKQWLGTMPALPEYDWGEEGVPKDKPLKYIKDIGLVIDES